MTLAILAAAPFVVALALACGFALDRFIPGADDFFSPENEREARQRAWEKHWTENAGHATRDARRT